MERIYRLHYRAQLKEEYEETQLQSAINACVRNIKILQREGRILTAGLYYYSKMLFLYYEAVGEPCKVLEPIDVVRQKLPKAEGGSCHNVRETMPQVLWESGEDVQATIPYPDDFLEPISTYLMIWPGQDKDRLWVHMYHIYYHSIPKSIEQLKRAKVPEKRRGRIAFLRDEKVFSYTYYHRAIVEEGLLLGDKYQSIALHENILFSYFEEPKTMVNRRNCAEESTIIEEWFKEDPESHFIHMPEGQGENFMLLPALFTLGIEDNIEV